MNQNTAEQGRSTPVIAPASRDASKNQFQQKFLRDRWHNLIATNFVIALGSRIQRASTEIYAGMKVQVGKDAICFPDITVVNGEPTFADSTAELLRNPTVVVEIFSDQTPVGDRTRRLQAFLATPSIKECVLVDQTQMRVEHYARQNVKHWTYRIYDERDDVISLEAINCKINLSEIYSGVKMSGTNLSSTAVN